MDIIVDACAAIHANGMATKGGVPLLEFVDRALTCPTYGITKAVKTECVRHGMGDWLQQLSDAGRLDECVNSNQMARAHQAKLRKKYKGRAPGINDAGLQLLAKRNDALLLTDDGNLRMTSHSEGVRCGDLFDLCIALRHRGVCSTGDIQILFKTLCDASPHYYPTGWSDLRKTGRTWPDALENLAEMRRPPAVLASELLNDGAAGREPSTRGK